MGLGLVSSFRAVFETGFSVELGLVTFSATSLSVASIRLIWEGALSSGA